MKHVGISHWTDLARDVARDDQRAAMEEHLRSGCTRCQETLDLVKRVVRATRANSRLEPPEHVVRCAKAIASMMLPPGSGLTRLIARLVGGGRPDPVLAGVRSEDRISRHALYEAGNFYVDVRLEQEKGASRATLVGQLTNREDPDGTLAGAPVLLLARKAIVGYAVYNRFGEFHMDYAPANNLRLCIALDPPDKRIELSLKELVPDVPTA